MDLLGLEPRPADLVINHDDRGLAAAQLGLALLQGTRILTGVDLFAAESSAGERLLGEPTVQAHWSGGVTVMVLIGAFSFAP